MAEFAGPVAVTGANGYVASWVVHELLSRGATVHATVRDPSNDKKVGHLRDFARDLPGTLKIFTADLLKPGSFRDAFSGCSVVFHTASPFHLDKDADPQKTLVEPALEGTRIVLADVAASPSVTRVVLTSSVAAMFGNASECAARGGTLDETAFNETSRLDHMPYSYSKLVAERAAWEAADAQDQYRLVVVNPGFVIGPSLSKNTGGTSVDFVLSLLDGRLGAAIWDFVTPWVDVRDVAVAHAEAGLRDDASGRHALSAGEVSMVEVAQWVRDTFGDAYQPPRWTAPKWLAWLIAPWIGYTREYVRENVGHPVRLDTTRSRERLGITYRPVRDSLMDHVDQLVDDGLISPRTTRAG